MKHDSHNLDVAAETGNDRKDDVSHEVWPCIDAHIHIDLYPVETREEWLEAAFADGVEAVVAVSMGLASSRENRRLTLRYPGRVFPAYGWHPEQEPLTEAEADELIDWIRERHAAGEAFAIGEVGLPYYKRTEIEGEGRAFDERPYLALLERFVALAAELDRAIVLHAVYEDADKACDLLQAYNITRAHFHWFKGDSASLRRMEQAGYMISVTPDIAYEEEIKALAGSYPLELLMAETDGPWPFEGSFAGAPTVPSMARHAVQGIAKAQGLDADETARKLLDNTKRFYKI